MIRRIIAVDRIHLVRQNLCFACYLAFCCLMPALLLYFLGYLQALSSKEVPCTVLTHAIAYNSCAYPCMCDPITAICQTCYYDCYDGIISVRYEMEGKVYFDTISVVSGVKGADAAAAQLRGQYPEGRVLTCYYNDDDHENAQISRQYERVYMIFVWVFAELGMLVCLLWIVCNVMSVRECVRAPKTQAS